MTNLLSVSLTPPSFSSVFCLLGITVATATIHHIYADSSQTLQLLRCFSAKKNCQTLVSTEQDGKDSLSCLHGIRVLTIFWIVFMHVGSEFSIERMVYNKSNAVKVIMVILGLTLASSSFSNAEFLTMGISRPSKWIICG